MLVDRVYKLALAPENNGRQPETGKTAACQDHDSRGALDNAGKADGLARSFVRLTNLSTYPFDRLSRYEARLWRQIVSSCSHCGASLDRICCEDDGCAEFGLRAAERPAARMINGRWRALPQYIYCTIVAVRAGIVFIYCIAFFSCCLRFTHSCAASH